MRPTRPPLLLLATLALLTLPQCKKIDLNLTPPAVNPLYQLPPATQTGQRTFGCLLNGQAWLPAGNILAGPLLTTGYSNDRLGISATHGVAINGANSIQRIEFSINNIQSAGTYLLNDTLRVGSYEDFDTSCKMYTSPSQVGKVVITKMDLVNRIVSGTFAFTLETPGCGKVVVTDGRFDSVF